MAAPNDYLCTLSPEDTPARVAQVRRLRQGLLSRARSEGRMTLRFAPELAAEVQAFVRDETACCGFYRFAVAETDDAVTLEVDAPAGAEGMLQGLFEVFASGDVTSP